MRINAREEGALSGADWAVMANVGLENISNTVILALFRDMT